jgi:2-amino-4-hydroxy-6-hydroxymethyldihydropteridine diphosphokinase
MSSASTSNPGQRLGIGLGSNLGNSLDVLRNVVGDIRAELHIPGEEFLVSRIYRTEPVDCPPGSPDFLNTAVELSCNLSVEDVLAWTQAREIAAGRPADHGFHTPRTLDLDLLYYGEQSVKSDHLVLPHPRIGERLFVLAPLADICPERILPGCPAGVAAKLRDLQNSQKTEQFPELLAGAFKTT